MGKPLITPIPTYYRGIYCRSRLEARWLAFLDDMEIKFSHESEPFQIPHTGERYLPDLHLPTFDIYAEIKPEGRTFESSDFDKCKRFLKYGVNNHFQIIRAILLLPGPPTFRPYSIVLREQIGEQEPEATVSTAILDIWNYQKLYAESRLFIDPPADVFRNAAEFSKRYKQAVEFSKSYTYKPCTPSTPAGACA